MLVRRLVRSQPTYRVSFGLTPEEQAVEDEFGPRLPPVSGALIVLIATIIYTAIFVAANIALVASLAHRGGRSAPGAVFFANFFLMMMGCLSYLVVDMYARGSPMRLYAVVVCAGPFLAFGIDCYVLYRFEIAGH
jgi:hypothetical protein